MRLEQEIMNMAFDISCTEQEYRKAYRIVQWRTGVLCFWPLAVLFSAFSFATGWMLRHTQTPFPWTILLFWGLGFAVPVGYLIYGRLYTRKRIWHYWHFYQKNGAVKKFCVYSDSFLLMTDSFRMKFYIADCRCMVERRDFYLLIENPKCFVVIPKRDVPPEKAEAFRAFLYEAFKNRHRVMG